MSEFFNSLLKIEMDLFLGRPEQDSNKLNGFKDREYVLGVVRKKIITVRDFGFRYAAKNAFEYDLPQEGPKGIRCVA